MKSIFARLLLIMLIIALLTACGDLYEDEIIVYYSITTSSSISKSTNFYPYSDNSTSRRFLERAGMLTENGSAGKMKYVGGGTMHSFQYSSLLKFSVTAVTARPIGMTQKEYERGIINGLAAWVNKRRQSGGTWSNELSVRDKITITY